MNSFHSFAIFLFVIFLGMHCFHIYIWLQPPEWDVLAPEALHLNIYGLMALLAPIYMH